MYGTPPPLTPLPCANQIFLMYRSVPIEWCNRSTRRMLLFQASKNDISLYPNPIGLASHSSDGLKIYAEPLNLEEVSVGSSANQLAQLIPRWYIK